MGETAEMTTPHWKVQHNYHDYSQVKDPGRSGGQQGQSGGGKQVGRKQDSKFPILLHYILGELEKEGKSHIMGWMSHGRAFMVRDQKLLEEEILPNWFRQKKFHSFQRQLNIYGFLRLTSGPDKGSYYHEMFLRGKRFLSERILRIKIKGEGPRKPNSPETEPNLYLYPVMAPSDEQDEGAVESATAPRPERATSAPVPISSSPRTNANRPDLNFLAPQQYPAPAFMNGFAPVVPGVPPSLHALLSIPSTAMLGIPTGAPLTPVSFILPPPPPAFLESDREQWRLMMQQQAQGHPKNGSSPHAARLPTPHDVTSLHSTSALSRPEGVTGVDGRHDSAGESTRLFPSFT